MTRKALPGENTTGDSTVRATGLKNGTIRVRIGPRYGTRGGTRIIDLTPDNAAMLVAQIADAISATVKLSN